MTMNSNHTVAGFIIGDLNPNSAIVTINGTGTISLYHRVLRGSTCTTRRTVRRAGSF